MQLLVVGNWKMAPEKVADAEKLAKATSALARTHKKNLLCVVCPPYIHIPAVAKAAKALTLGAQTVSGTIDAAQTGAVSAAMLKVHTVSYCIVGHSESRARGETNDDVRDQVLRLLEKKIMPIVCVGERERDTQGWYLSTIKEQLEAFLSVIPKAALKNLVIAYEPVWAIGAKAQREATAAECREMTIFIRKIISDMFDEKGSAAVQILYGGSVNEQNAKSFIADGNAQGLLVGRVSLEPKRLAALAAALVK